MMIYLGLFVRGDHVSSIPGHCVWPPQESVHSAAGGGGVGPHHPHPQQHRRDIRRGEDGLERRMLPHHWYRDHFN